MPILLWHLPWVVLFGAWDVAVSARDTRNVESHVDAQAALDQTRLPPEIGKSPYDQLHVGVGDLTMPAGPIAVARSRRTIGPMGSL